MISPTGFDEVAKYIKEHKTLPGNYITKEQAKALGWKNKEGNLHNVAPGKSIGGNIFRNNEGLLPNKSGRTWYEADINYLSGYRGNDRILYSSDGLIYKTSDHYKTLKEKLDLPSYYGENADALWDCLTGWIDTPITIKWEFFEESKKTLGSYASLILETFQDAQEEMPGEFFIAVKQ
ncbi:barstar family protein [Bacillus cereus]|uniref:barstar family protein n=1 Tax=Bacillus cereus TaxID=1396 RepID=UPI0039816497